MLSPQNKHLAEIAHRRCPSDSQRANNICRGSQAAAEIRGCSDRIHMGPLPQRSLETRVAGEARYLSHLPIRTLDDLVLLHSSE